MERLAVPHLLRSKSSPVYMLLLRLPFLSAAVSVLAIPGHRHTFLATSVIVLAGMDLLLLKQICAGCQWDNKMVADPLLVASACPLCACPLVRRVLMKANMPVCPVSISSCVCKSLSASLAVLVASASFLQLPFIKFSENQV